VALTLRFCPDWQLDQALALRGRDPDETLHAAQEVARRSARL